MSSKKDNKKKTKGFKEFDPKKYIDVKPDLKEAPKMGTAVITFGRMNPITTGHEVLVNKVIDESLKRSAFAGVYLSHTQDKKKNPLSYDQKLIFAQKAFGKVIRKSGARTIIEVAQELSLKFKNLVVVVGSDRVKEFEILLNKYNGKEYKFDQIEVISAGERDPDADDVSGMSASKMRLLAKQNDENEFKKGLPKKLQSSANIIMKTVRAGMGLEESALTTEELGEAVLTRTQRIRRAMMLRRMKSRIKMGQRRARRRKAPLSTLKKRARRLAIRRIKARLAKGSRYADMSYSQRQVIDRRLAKIPSKRLDTLAKRLLPRVKRAERDRFARMLGPVKDIKKEDLNDHFEQFIIEKKLVKQDPDVKHLPGSQPKGYYKGVPKDKKDDRFRHFTSNAKKSDRDPKAYKKAPGDAGAETKPSKHTKKFAQQFGEACETDTQPRKRFHMLLDKNGCVVHDMRFKMYRKAREMERAQQAVPVQEDMEEVISELLALQEAVDQVEQRLIEDKGTPQHHQFQKTFKHAMYHAKTHQDLDTDGDVDSLEKMIPDEITGTEKNQKALQKKVKKKHDAELKHTRLGVAFESTSEEQLDESNPLASVRKKAEQTGISYSILKQVFDRGVAAWKGGHRPGTTPAQWGLARINSFATGGKTRTTADADLWAKHKGKKESTEVEEGSETWESGYKRRVVKTTKPEHKEKGYNWRIKGKDRPEISIKLYKEKPSFKEFTKQMKRVAGHEFGG